MLLSTACNTDFQGDGTPFSVSVPEDTALSRDIDRSLFRVNVSIDKKSVSMNPDSDFTTWRSSLELPADRAVPLDVEWFYANMLVARHSQMIGPITEPTTLTLASDVYVTTGSEFDLDNDNFSNLEEVQQNTNPEDPRNIDVVIPAISEIGGPGINGFGGVIWDATTNVDWRGDPLLIDNLMIDAGADREDGSTEFRWQGLHDGENLFLIVFAESMSIETPNADSKSAVRDDALNIYIDGNNSKQSTYDGVDDYHLIIPLFKLLTPDAAFAGSELVFDDSEDIVRDDTGNIKIVFDGQEMFVSPALFVENKSADADRRIQRGSESLPVPDSITFENGWNRQVQQVYEVKIRLSEVGISVGEPFGFELQLDDDNDNGGRDARYGWRHPSRNSVTDIDSNQTSKNPTYMGTAILQ